jgi:branched-chain amino acid transport system ATP-binding protein
MLLKTTNLSAGYGKVPVLHEVNFHIEEGKTVAIIGPNGAGKSTLLKVISGLMKPSNGTVEYQGRIISGSGPDVIVRSGLIYVPEGGHPFPNMSVYDNLLMGAFGNRQALKTGVMDEMYEVFPRLKERRDQLAKTLSGGERQMLALARGLISRPKMIMLDEPSLGLAPKLVEEIYEKISVLRKELGLTVLLVEQNIGYALELADRGYVLENGHIILEGNRDFLMESEHVQKAYLGLT